jgi:hypothetical protein
MVRAWFQRHVGGGVTDVVTRQCGSLEGYDFGVIAGLKIM